MSERHFANFLFLLAFYMVSRVGFEPTVIPVPKAGAIGQTKRTRVKRTPKLSP